jgi:hypothetical protein
VKSLLGVMMATTLLAAQAAAQSVVGRALVDGRVALLYDNGTWKYEAPVDGSSSAPCDPIAPRIQFCGQPLGWTFSPPASPEINAVYRIDARHYAQYIIEDLGTDDGVTSEYMRNVVIQNAEMITGSPVEVIDVQPVEMGGLAGDSVTYRVNFNGLGLIFTTSVFLEPKVAMQISTYAVASELTDEHAALHALFLEHTKLVP